MNRIHYLVVPAVLALATAGCPRPGPTPTPTYTPCFSSTDCTTGQVCDTSACLSCCPDAPPGTACIAACCGQCVVPTSPCTSDADCTAGAEWCEGGECVACDNGGVVCDLYCPNGMVDPRNGCQPCACRPYVPCLANRDCDSTAGQVCDRSDCLSCCPGAPPGTPCIEACCGFCAPPPSRTCTTDAECTFGAEWCEGGVCVPCDNSALVCLIDCTLVDPRNGCQPCACRPSYVPCLGDGECGPGEVCDTTDCLSCCPDAPPGTACIAVCCGRCEAPVGTRCGGFAGIVCPAGEFCDFAPGDLCGFADAMGTCRMRPDACIDLYDPVCGCDGLTYSNACYANMAYVSVATAGACGTDCRTSGCVPGEYCAYCWGSYACIPEGAIC